MIDLRNRPHSVSERCRSAAAAGRDGILRATANHGPDRMSSQVQCARLGRLAEGLDKPPYPGELGRRIQAQISKPAWEQWLAHQTMLINENRLSPRDPQARAWLAEQMERFLFGGDVEQPAGYVPPES